MSSFSKSYSFILLLQIFSKVAAINLALNKLSSYCNDGLLLNKMVDGIKTLSNFERYTKPCRSRSYVQVHLGGKHVVHYIIVFEGEGNDEGQLDFFTVSLTEFSEFTSCSEFPGTANLNDKGRGLRVNCLNSRKMYSKVYINSLKNIGFTITEIEVHSLAQPGEGTLIPFGCFNGFGSMDREHDLASCISVCTIDKFIFLGVKNNKICACSNKPNKHKEILMTNCDVPCSNSPKYCGGSESYSVYLIALLLPNYIGCLRTSANFISNSVGHDDMTVAKCLHLCENQRYALLQSGDHCICQDSVDKSHISFGQVGCTTKCTGETNMVCGGEEMASVFFTCSTDAVIIPCSDLFKCEGSYDMFGDCGGVCKYGFHGDHCLERDYEAKILFTTEPVTRSITESLSKSTVEPVRPATCSPKNKCLEQPNTGCVSSEGKERCVCLEGYTKDDDGEECKDVDECKYDPCDGRSSECINFNGSYVCQCKDGFIKLTDDICLRNETADLYEVVGMNYIFLLLPLISLLCTMLYFHSKAPLSTESRGISLSSSRISGHSIRVTKTY